MDAVLDATGGVFLVAGSLLLLVAGIGVVRFGDVYSRMHAAAKAPTLGIMLIGLGAALTIRSVPAAVTAVLVVVLQLVTGPVGAHVLGRSVYVRVHPHVDGPDELGERRSD
jgi:multicomponent Na+:H+ antiporter subunit G